MTGVPPLLEGAAQVSVADPSLPVALTPVGAPGTDAPPQAPLRHKSPGAQSEPVVQPVGHDVELPEQT